MKTILSLKCQLMSKLSFLLCFLPAFSFALENQLGVQARSFGGAYRAVASCNDTIFYNPAGLLKVKRTSIDSDYKIMLNDQSHNISTSLVDSETTGWAMGIAYSGEFYKEKNKNFNHLLHLLIAMPIYENLYLGTSFYYLNNSNNNDNYKNFFNMDAGVLLALPAGLSLALVADHIIQAKGKEKSLGLSAGLAYNLAPSMENVPLLLAVDWTMDELRGDKLRHSLSAGLQYILFTMVPVRLGLRSELADRSHMISFGSGFILESFSLDALYGQNLTRSNLREMGIAGRFKF